MSSQRQPPNDVFDGYLAKIHFKHVLSALEFLLDNPDWGSFSEHTNWNLVLLTHHFRIRQLIARAVREACGADLVSTSFGIDRDRQCRTLLADMGFTLIDKEEKSRTPA